MNTEKCCLWIFINILFPNLENHCSKKKIKKSIELIEVNYRECNKNSKYISDYVHLEKKDIEVYYNQSFERKERLEKKATSFIGVVTIYFSIIIGLMAIVIKDIDKIINNIPWIVMLIYFVMLIYLLICLLLGTFYDFDVLFKYNKIYTLDPKDIKLDFIKYGLAYCTVLNEKYNLLRNNCLVTLAKFVRNSMVTLLLFGLLIAYLPHINKEVASIESRGLFIEKSIDSFSNQMFEMKLTNKIILSNFQLGD
jgi:hypothetical protein